MARPLRLAFADGVYHVTARGNERKAIVRDDTDGARFLDTLAAAVGGGGVAGDGAADGSKLQCGQPARERCGAAAGGGASLPRAACQTVRWQRQDLTAFFDF